MDVSNSDADFDAYWEEEARNPNRNRIRIGRQYQATVPPLLKSGESDGRKLEELETLRWKPDNELLDPELDQYLSVAKAVTLFARAIDCNYNRNNESECVNDLTSENADENDAVSQNKSVDVNPEPASGSGDRQMQTALKGLSGFVTSHHSVHHDVGCRMPMASDVTNKASSSSEGDAHTVSVSGEWTQKETQLFTKALEVFGKNFSAIKKTFLPWKSVKSIIEYYYLGGDKEVLLKDVDLLKDDSDSETPRDNNANDLSVQCSSSSATTSSSVTDGNATDSRQSSQVNQKPEEVSNSESKNPDDSATCGTSDSGVSVSGQEVKPLKAKPILPSVVQESSGGISTVGSLKFYKDGQLVLKLNAQQEQTGHKCQWVESQDTPKLPRPVKKRNKRLLIDKHENENHLLNNHRPVNVNSDEIDDASVESSDDDSLESNESIIIPSPSAVIAKKARVKVENNCHKPISSPNSTSVKEYRTENTHQCNRNNVKSENTFNIKKEPSNHSPTNSSSSIDDERKKKYSIFNTLMDNSTERRNSTGGSLENKWYHTIIEKHPQHPPRAHSASMAAQFNRQLRCETTQTTTSTTSSSNAIPVDLTRKSLSCSPVDTNTKSSPSSSSTPNSASNHDKEAKTKVMESPSPPQINQFIFPSYLPLSPNQGQSKIKKDVKSPNYMCQKSDGKMMKSSPPDSPSSMSPSPSQLTWLQNSFVPYAHLPIYEQYYRYFCTYGMHPSANHSPSDETSSSSQKSSSHTPNEKSEIKEERSKCLSQPVFGMDGDEGTYNNSKSSLVTPEND